MAPFLPTFADYQSYAARFAIDRTQAQTCIDACAPQEIGVVYRMSDYGGGAILLLLRRYVLPYAT